MSYYSVKEVQILDSRILLTCYIEEVNQTEVRCNHFFLSCISIGFVFTVEGHEVSLWYFDPLSFPFK